ncbi:putative glutathione S-transferase isoform 1 [Galdieria sulphuraria]|uniref:Putative glutathione S-transferase isoform 1 n=1 Tax=Galdieria sulphuraria TaxID=130081 RepID=M2X1M3_GALSU|nr:putative glutathione S-transferase isoform 1 [Galdieria sulphuraria]EME30260.1 putative glutathione S-transferase isoform 1 [Galdieria sulphuraria]|eukprot:XP_005706780.1 putative glutathione S-transferase isoform 1 [Galdieria sulphuraria]
MTFVHGMWSIPLKKNCVRLVIGKRCLKRTHSLNIFMDSKQQHKAALDDVNQKGHFVRRESQFRNWISREKIADFAAEPCRYHLYVSLACPWAHRTLIVRKLKGLEPVIGCTVVHYHMDSMGWRFIEPGEKVPFCTPDEINGAKRLRDIYFQVDPGYDGRFTVPLLWDKKRKTIVNNESAEIIRMLNSEFNEFAENPALDLYPAELTSKIDAINGVIYENVNNGVYKAGFARTQEAYEEAVTTLFHELEHLEQILSKSRYLCGNQVTEADIRLFTTLIRFDAVYQYHFKCNLRPLYSFPNLHGFTLDMYQLPGVKETVSFEHIKKHYYMSHPTINPFGIVPMGPKLDFSVSHNRDTQFS